MTQAIAALRTDINRNMSDLRTELKQEIASLRTDVALGRKTLLDVQNSVKELQLDVDNLNEDLFTRVTVDRDGSSKSGTVASFMVSSMNSMLTHFKLGLAPPPIFRGAEAKRARLANRSRLSLPVASGSA